MWIMFLFVCFYVCLCNPRKNKSSIIAVTRKTMREHLLERAPWVISLRLCSSSPDRAELTFCIATWLQAPGAAPQSTTLCPGFKTRNFSSICSSLNALLHRKFSFRDAFTYGSLSCRCNQRCSAALLPFGVFIKQSEV